MTTWKPAWKTSDDAVPVGATYHGPDGFSVTVDPVGLITVVQDDWLSKYALAIHGDMHVLPTFLRGRPGGRWVPIPEDSVDRIFTGETLLHMPTLMHTRQWYDRYFVPKQQPVQGVSPPPVILTPTAPDWNFVLGRTGNTLDVVAGLLTFTEAGAFVTLLSVPVFVVGAVWDFVEAWETDIRVEMLLASAYAATAWVFDDLYKSGELTRPVTAEAGSPALRFPLPPGAVSMKTLHQVYKDKQDPQFWVDKHTAAWVQTTELVIGDLEVEYQRTLYVGTARPKGYRGPHFTRRQFREELRRATVAHPGSTSGAGLLPHWLNRTEFYDLMIEVYGDKTFGGWMSDKWEKELFEYKVARFPKPRSATPGSDVPPAEEEP